MHAPRAIVLRCEHTKNQRRIHPDSVATVQAIGVSQHSHAEGDLPNNTLVDISSAQAQTSHARTRSQSLKRSKPSFYMLSRLTWHAIAFFIIFGAVTLGPTRPCRPRYTITSHSHTKRKWPTLTWKYMIASLSLTQFSCKYIICSACVILTYIGAFFCSFCTKTTKPR